MGNVSKKQLINFLQSRYYLQESKSFIDKILKSYPQFLYEGSAYRAIALSFDERFSWSKKFFLYNSWAKSYTGIMSFLDNYQREHSEPNQVVMVEGYIKGLDLQAVIKYLENEGEKLSSEIFQIHKEEEVLCVEFDELEIVPNSHFYDEHIEGMVSSLCFRIEEALSDDSLSEFNFQTIKEDLSNVSFFLKSLALKDKWKVEETLEVLQSLRGEVSSSEIYEKLVKLGFLK
jgi:hypothetical protein